MKPTPRTAAGFENVYDPAEDSFFLLDCLEKDEKYLQKFACPTIVELGTGTGIVSAFVPQLIGNDYWPLATDLNPAACQCAIESWKINWPNKLGINVLRGDLLTFMRPHLVDVLVFNPPYVPSASVPPQPEETAAQDDDRWVDLALDGGTDGMEVTNRVLEKLDQYLSPEGAAYILFIDGNHPKQIHEQMQSQGWHSCHIDTRRAGREVLSVYRFSRQ